MQNINLLTDIYHKDLAKAAVKRTYPRERIFIALVEARRPLSIQEMAGLLLDVHQVTIYRNIELLSRHGIVIKVPHGFKYRYELSEDYSTHHHHAVCQKCGKSFTIKSQQIEYLLDEAATMVGVTPISHHIEVVGVCRRCDKQLAKDC